MVAQLKKVARKSKTFIIASNIYHNWRTERRFKAGDIEYTGGSTHSVVCHFSLPQSLGYINDVFNDFLQYSGFTPEMLRGKKVLEVGHGDSVGVALRFIAAGAERVVCIDKFYSKQDATQQHSIYTALREQLSGDERRRFDEAVDLKDGIKLDEEKLKAMYGTGIEDAGQAFEPGYFDIIISRGALQSVYEIDSAFSVMDRLLRPGGQMWHKIDLSDLGMFSGMNPLTFLTVPESIYRLMIKDTGKANRRLINYYRDKMGQLGYQAKYFVTSIFGRKDLVVPHKEEIVPGIDYSEHTMSLIKQIRPQLDSRFRDMSDEDLAIAGLFLIATKPPLSSTAK
jgi:SAM-dependent methyltransferase